MDDTTSKEILAFFGSPVALAPFIAIVVQQIKGLAPRLDDGSQSATSMVILMAWLLGGVVMALGWLAGLTPEGTPLGMAIAMGVLAGLISNGVYATIKNTPHTTTTSRTTTVNRPASVPASSVTESPVARG